MRTTRIVFHLPGFNPLVGLGQIAEPVRIEAFCSQAAVRQPWSRFQFPPRQTQRAVFPHCAFLVASRQGLWDLIMLGALSAQMHDELDSR